MTGATVTFRDDTTGALARVDDVAIRPRGLEDEAEVRALRRGDEVRATPVRTRFLIGREQDFPADFAGVRRLLEGLERGEHRHDAALHVGHAGTIDALGVEPAALLKRIGLLVNGVEMSAEEQLRARLGPQANPQRIGGAGAGQFLELCAGKPREFGAQRIEHPVEAGAVARAGIDVGPVNEQLGEFGGARRQAGDGVGNRHGENPETTACGRAASMRLRSPSVGGRRARRAMARDAEGRCPRPPCRRRRFRCAGLRPRARGRRRIVPGRCR